MINEETNKIKVIVADDSALMRKLIPELLKTDTQIEVVATAMDGMFALKKIEQHRPDVITLDIMMPNMDGLTALRHIVSQFRIPVIIVSSLTQQGATITLEALELGAVDFVAKPQSALPEQLREMASELIEKIKAVARCQPRLRQQREFEPILATTTELIERKPIILDSRTAAQALICIGVSTGGPEALACLLPKLPARLAAGVMIVQHMPAGFTAQLAQRLNKRCELEVKEAADGDLVLPGRVLIAPGGRHMRVKRLPLATTAVVVDGIPVSGHCPSVDVLFAAAATEFSARAIGIILTGMGEDGVIGLGQIKQAGGLTIAQDQASSVIYGMPKAALARGYASEVLSLEQMADYLVQKVGLL
ncbi:MAG: chemotaxis response regulator protein-glutamate methylesterase [Acidobacteriota bacterium]